MAETEAVTAQGATINTRQKLIAATERLLRRDGLARVTTRKIAQEAGVAEGALYHHFKDKAELVHAVVQQSMGDFRKVLENLPLLVGQRTVRENLEHTLIAAYETHYRIVPIVCSLYADHKLLARTREIVNERAIGPECSASVLAAYLQAEQRLGRVNAGINAQAAAEMLLSDSFHKAMLDRFLLREVTADSTRMQLRETVQILLSGIDPRPSDINLVPLTGN